MLNKEEIIELKFFADKVATVHGPEHSEYIKINEILKNIENNSIKKEDLTMLRELTNNYIIPEGACKAQTTLLNLLGKLDKELM